jgi:hypothetical protein
VNGFFNRRGDARSVFAQRGSPRCGESHYDFSVTTDVVNLAEIIVLHLERCRLYAGLLLMVWVLKREVRAFGGCLGMYRRRRTWHAAISVGEL